MCSLVLPPEAKNSGELEISTFCRLSALSGKASTISNVISQNTKFLGDNIGDNGLVGNSDIARSELPAIWNAPRKEFPRPAACPHAVAEL